ncbi:uncharacterized protein LOC107047654, partial [Diachasma alloeum]|uniref:uncharacterized protein LOC107047654 n=1 Tax=Diachasma alloeum TaxID=454923 RepID=UPI0007382C87
MSRLSVLKGTIGEIKREDIAKLKSEDIEAHHRIVETQWTNFSSYHEQMLEEATEEIFSHPYFISDVFEEALYNLEKIKLPDFDGKYGNWKSFHDIYASLVHNQPFSDIDKMVRLKNALNGKASELISNIGPEAANYQFVWAKLVARYENPRLIMAAHLNKILNLRELKEKSATGLLFIIDTVSEALEALKNLGAPVEHWDIIVAHIVRKVIDTKTREDWEMSLGDSTKPPELKVFMEFLKARARALENVERDEDGGASGKRFQKPKSSASVNQVSYAKKASGKSSSGTGQTCTPPVDKKRECRARQEDHWLGPECPKFMELRPHERKQFLTDKGLCYNCLGPHR